MKALRTILWIATGALLVSAFGASGPGHEPEPAINLIMLWVGGLIMLGLTAIFIQLGRLIK